MQKIEDRITELNRQKESTTQLDREILNLENEVSKKTNEKWKIEERNRLIEEEIEELNITLEVLKRFQENNEQVEFIEEV